MVYGVMAFILKHSVHFGSDCGKDPAFRDFASSEFIHRSVSQFRQLDSKIIGSRHSAERKPVREAKVCAEVARGDSALVRVPRNVTCSSIGLLRGIGHLDARIFVVWIIVEVDF